MTGTFAELTRDEYVSLLRYAGRWLDRREDAEDAVQEALMRAWRGWAAFRGDCAVSTWLHVIVRNQSIYALRGHRGKDWVELTDSHGVLERTSETLDARHALDSIFATRHGALARCLSEEISMAQIGARFGITELAAKSRVFRLRLKLEGARRKTA
jgi:RNA polymerase sigma factor (sigma-70 family)